MDIRRQFRLPLLLTVLVLVSVFKMSEAANVSYVYDGLNRLIQAIYDDGKIITYTYDKAGNRVVRDIALLQEVASAYSKRS